MKLSNFFSAFILCALLQVCPLGSFAQRLRLDGGFTSNMVIQRNKTVRIFGSAPANTNVTVKFNKQKVTVKSAENGRFIAELKPMQANAKGQQMIVQAGKQKVTLNDVLIGEVWIASGQSNMEFNMGPQWRKGSGHKTITPAKGENLQQQELDFLQKSPFKGDKEGLFKGDTGGLRPLLRSLVIEKDLNQDTIPTKGWEKIDGETIIPISAAGYFFAKNLADSLKVPVGLITTAWGGTRIEGWMNPEYSLTDPTISKYIKDGKMQGEGVGFRFKRMVKELAPMAIQGVIWYQGCSNLTTGTPEHYDLKEQSLVNGWMKAFDNDEMGFYYVQLAPYQYSTRKTDPVPNTWRALADFRPMQILPADKFPHSGMAATIDLCDNLRDIHPTYKWEVGRRLALQALVHQYGRTGIVCDGPKCINKEFYGKEVILTFDQPLKTNDGKDPNWFSLASGSSYYPATSAKIDGNKVIVSCNKVKGNPTRAHYAWDEDAITNLCNEQGLPALPF